MTDSDSPKLLTTTFSFSPRTASVVDLETGAVFVVDTEAEKEVGQILDRTFPGRQGPQGELPVSVLPPVTPVNIPQAAPIAWRRPASQPASRKSRRDPEVAERRAYIRSLGDVPDETYWKLMDARYRTHATWQAWGCPESYVAASKVRNRETRDHFLRVQKEEIKNAWKEVRKKNPRQVRGKLR